MVFRAIRLRFPLKLLFTKISLTYCTVPVLYGTVLYLLYRCRQNDESSNQLSYRLYDSIICLIDALRFFFSPIFFFTPFFILLSLSDSICSFVIVILLVDF